MKTTNPKLTHFFKNFKLEEFNSCYPEEIKSFIVERFITNINDSDLWTFELVDSDRTYWQNNHDTLVFKITNRGTPLGLALGELAQRHGADEFDWYSTKMSEGKPGPTVYYVRLWWD